MYFWVLLPFLINCVQCARILGVFMYPSFSHQLIYRQICTELSSRGHQITLVTPNPSKHPTSTNLTEISIDFVYDVLKKNHVQEEYCKDMEIIKLCKNGNKIVDLLVELVLNSTQFRRLISDETQKFDLILIHYVHPVMYGLAARYKAPIISISTLNVFSTNYDSVGTSNHPVLFPEYLFNFRPGYLTLREKFESVYFFLWQRYYHRWDYLPRIDQMARKYFGDIPYIGDLESKVSMLFVYGNILLDPLRPNVPAVLDLSFMNLEAPKPLPDDLQNILDQATEGVIYVSFGTNIKTSLFKETLRSSILQALVELPYKVLLKWDSNDFITKSPNVVVRKWYPQRDILAHPNVKVFITQGGLQSIEDAILGEVPLIGIPFVTDQPKNVRSLVEIGIGEQLDADAVNKEEIKSVIIKVAETASYEEKIKKVRKILVDKTMSGLESAIWWCEYVIRHKGARHLRSPAVDTSYIDYFSLDVNLFLILVLFLLFLIRVKQ